MYLRYLGKKKYVLKIGYTLRLYVVPIIILIGSPMKNQNILRKIFNLHLIQILVWKKETPICLLKSIFYIISFIN